MDRAQARQLPAGQAAQGRSEEEAANLSTFAAAAATVVNPQFAALMASIVDLDK